MTSEALTDKQPVLAKEKILSFGKYLLLSRVSIGGMAEVFKAIPEGATRIEQVVAIKRILPSIAEDGQFIGMFIDEARIAGQLDHPNICRIHELGKVGDAHYIAMQFLWGRDLLKVMNRFRQTTVPMPTPMAMLIAERACAALHYAHNKRDAEDRPLNIIHRDVSPQNIIVAYSGQVKLIDFGVAKAASQNQKTQAGILKGKFGYMSPEMIRGLPVDHRSDVFAMGVCLHEALTGARLFLGETDFATLEAVRDARVEPPSKKNPEVSPELDAIVLKALARDADDRYASAAELETALREERFANHSDFDEETLATLMQRAFAAEIAREKTRLDDVAALLREHRLVRGAEVLALPSESHALHPPVGSEAVPDLDANTRPVENPLSLAGEWSDERGTTQIFFSADELSEIHELESEPLPLFTTPYASPVSLDHLLNLKEQPSPTTRTPSVSGTFTRSKSRLDETLEMPLRAPGESLLSTTATLPSLSERPRTERARRWILAALIAAVLGVGFYHWHTRMGAIEVLDPGVARTVVRIDGVVRGNPPLAVRGLRPGFHRVQVEASGYAVAQHIVQVTGGDTTTVSVLLERLAPVAESTVRPVVEPRLEVAPAKTAASIAATAVTPRVRHTKSADKRMSAAATSSPATPADSDLLASASVAPRNTSAEATEAGAKIVSPESPPFQPAQAPQLPSDGKGELLISTLPWSHVFIDDVDTGRDTPVRSLRIDPGPHRLGLRTPDGTMHTVEIYMDPGQVVRVIRRF